ncbi:MAG: hypothetical protein K9J30_10355 [Bacteroidales bacterium]|nr:hypothetical protein [Bacteroidales bacterium]
MNSAKKTATPAGLDMGLFFENPDKSVAGLLVNRGETVKMLTIEIEGKAYAFRLKPNSFNSLQI